MEISVKSASGKVERWIEMKGSRENELSDAELLVVVAACQRSSAESGVSRHQRRESLVE